MNANRRGDAAPPVIENIAHAVAIERRGTARDPLLAIGAEPAHGAVVVGDEDAVAAGTVRVVAERRGVGGVTRVVEVVPDADSEPDAKATARAHYVHGDLVTRVEFNARTVEHLADFGSLLAEQLKALPADG